MLKRMRRGFTLVELMVVMAIIALLLALALPRYFKHLDLSRETILKQDLAVMRDAIDKYHGDTGRYPDSLDALSAHATCVRSPSTRSPSAPTPGRSWLRRATTPARWSTSRAARRGRRTTAAPMPTGKPAQSGFTYLFVLMLVALIGMGLAAAGTLWHTESQRAREANQLFIGGRGRRAGRGGGGRGPARPRRPRGRGGRREGGRRPGGGRRRRR